MLHNVFIVHMNKFLIFIQNDRKRKQTVKNPQNQTMTFDSTGIILYNVYNENDEFSNTLVACLSPL